MTTGNHPYEPQFLGLGGRDLRGEYIEDVAERAESQQAAYGTLKGMTGRDFGYDPEQWRAWMEANPDWNRDRIKAYIQKHKEKA